MDYASIFAGNFRGGAMLRYHSLMKESINWQRRSKAVELAQNVRCTSLWESPYRVEILELSSTQYHGTVKPSIYLWNCPQFPLLNITLPKYCWGDSEITHIAFKRDQKLNLSSDNSSTILAWISFLRSPRQKLKRRRLLRV